MTMNTAVSLPNGTALTFAALGGNASADVPQNVYEPNSPATEVRSSPASCASGGTAGSPAALVGHGAAAVPTGEGNVIGGMVGLGDGLDVGAGLSVGGSEGAQQTVGKSVGVGALTEQAATDPTTASAPTNSGIFIGYLPASRCWDMLPCIRRL
jgi:hypothetical protein